MNGDAELSSLSRVMYSDFEVVEKLINSRTFKASAFATANIYEAALHAVADPRHDIHKMTTAVKAALRNLHSQGEVEVAGRLLLVLEVLASVAAVQHILREWQDVLHKER